MSHKRISRPVHVKAFAKINLTLRVLGARPDGYHNVQTVLQSIALHDALTFRAVRGVFRIECDDPACPTDRTNLVWRAAKLVWRATGRRGEPRHAIVRILKRIPLQSGLGGGSSDAAAAIRGLAALWRSDLSRGSQHAMAADLGADVPFFLEGGTALGLERGELLFPLADWPPAWVTLVFPPFGVSTKDAYGWWEEREASNEGRRRSVLDTREHSGASASASGGSLEPNAWGWGPTPGRKRSPRHMRNVGGQVRASRLPAAGLGNDLEPVVTAHHPEIARIVRILRRQGARYAAMSGSGSAVFGLFGSRAGAEAAARTLGRRAYRSLVTRTLGRARYQALTRPRHP